MLRITNEFNQEAPALRLEGKLVGPWVEVMRRAWRETERVSPRVRLDLGAMTFTDDAGRRLLREMVRSGCEVVSCSKFVAELLNTEMSS